MPEAIDGWVPAAGETPQEREKRLKREKRDRKLQEQGLPPVFSSSHLNHYNTHSSAAAPTPTPSAPAFTADRRANEEYAGWRPMDDGESPAEREKRMKREKRAAMLAGAAAPVAALPSTRREGEEYDGWRPMDDGESPAEREKRIKREKRAAMLAGQSAPTSTGPPAGYGQGSTEYRPQQSYGAPPHLSASAPSTGALTIDPARAAILAAAEAAEHAAAEAAKKSKHAQSKTPARLKYLERKKKVRKAKKKATPAQRAAAGGEGREGSVAGSAVAGGKRKRDDDEEDDDESGSDDEHSDGEASVAASTTTAPPTTTTTTTTTTTSTPPTTDKASLIAAKKAERREARLAKKAEIKRIKAEGGVVPPPKKRVVETTKPRAREEEMQIEEEEKEEEKSEEQREKERKEVEEKEAIRVRKEQKALKKLQRRLPPAEVAAADAVASSRTAPSDLPAATVTNDDDDTPMDDSTEPAAAFLLPTAPAPASAVLADGTSVPSRRPQQALLASPSPEPQPLLRLPGATRPALPSTAVLSALRVHEQVRGKVVVDPGRKVRIGVTKSEGEGGYEDGTGVSERGRKRLAGGEMVVEEWFAVQTAVIPLLLPPSSLSPRSPSLLYPPHPPRDLLVSAPTGSGKTLSYVVPLVETLSGRTVTRLRALVLLPTRDLVGQVRETFEGFAKGTGLKIGVATGQHSFAHEQSVLVGPSSAPSSALQGGSSLVDILIATPGRLIDHLKATKGFTLQHLRFLVVDEADRLLTQSFHDWLPTVLSALKPSPPAAVDPSVALPAAAVAAVAEDSAPVGLKRADAVAPLWWDAPFKEGVAVGIGRVEGEGEERSFGSCQKLLFSATLSRDPAKIDALQLHRPIYISVEDTTAVTLGEDGEPLASSNDLSTTALEDLDGEKRFTFPKELEEKMVVSPASHKPLYLFHLLHSILNGEGRQGETALCFTKSVEAATRLAKLVEFFEEAYSGEGKKVVVKAFSSELAPGERKRALKDFKDGKITMLIASDVISRGIDLPNVSHVISYDIPADMRKYVHRVGRTARAGNRGEGWSLVEEQEVAPFKAIMTSAQHYSKIQRVRIKDKDVEAFVPAYQTALDKLKVHFATGGAARERAQAASGTSA